MKHIKGKLTFANVISCFALFVALGGAAYAAGHLGKNSVGTKQIKKGAVTGIKIKKGTITGTQINLAKLGTVPSASNAATAGTANALAPMEPTRLVGAAGQPEFLDGSHNVAIEGSSPFKFPPVGFYKDHEGVVHLTGAVQTGKGTKPVPGLLFTLPPGYRPASGVAEVLQGYKETSLLIFGSNVSIEGIELSGDVLLSPPKEGELGVLSGLTFRAES